MKEKEQNRFNKKEQKQIEGTKDRVIVRERKRKR